MSKYTTAMIHDAADRILARGERPTQAAIRQELGGASYTTIASAMRSWSPPPENLSDLPRVVVDSIKNLWEKARKEADEGLNKEREEFAQWRQCLEEEVDRLLAVLEREEIALVQARQENQSLARENATLETRLQYVTDEKEKVQADLSVTSLLLFLHHRRNMDLLKLIEAKQKQLDEFIANCRKENENERT